MGASSRLDAVPAAALACDAAGCVTGVNRRCAALFGGDDAGLCGTELSSLFPNEHDVQTRLLRSAGSSIRLQGRRRTGAAVYVEAEAALAADGSITCRLWDVLGAAARTP
jgi:PAS domain-containing protein